MKIGELIDPPKDAGPGDSGALIQLRAYLAQAGHPHDMRLPPERELARGLGVTRAELRKALSVLEREGVLWRHVGKGTFLGTRPGRLGDIGELAQRTNPAEVVRTRLVLEPELARLAALYATADHIDSIAIANKRCREAETWRQYEHWDAEFHHRIAQATQNALLLGLFDLLNAVRRTATWSRLRLDQPSPASNHHSFSDHDRILEAIEARQPEDASEKMRRHLRLVEARMLGEI
jgi:DNA-binding FadR family transcriptional regulator